MAYFPFLTREGREPLDREAIIKLHFQREEGWGWVGRIELIVHQRLGFIEVWGRNRAFTNHKGYFSQIRSAHLIGLHFVGGIRLPVQPKSSDQRERTSNKKQIIYTYECLFSAKVMRIHQVITRFTEIIKDLIL